MTIKLTIGHYRNSVLIIKKNIILKMKNVSAKNNIVFISLYNEVLIIGVKTIFGTKFILNLYLII